MSATDEDSGKLGQISYSIKSPSTAKIIFQIDSSAGKKFSGTSGGRGVRTLSVLALPRFQLRRYLYMEEGHPSWNRASPLF